MTEDMMVHTSRPLEGQRLLRKDTRILVDLYAISEQTRPIATVITHRGTAHNPNDYPDPEAFVPRRWYGVKERDYPMFGSGPRACIGRKIALTEAMGFVVQFFRDWDVETVLRDGETNDTCLRRLMANASFQRTTLAINDVSLRITSRYKS